MIRDHFINTGWLQLNEKEVFLSHDIFVKGFSIRLVAKVEGDEPVYSPDTAGIIPENITFELCLYNANNDTTSDYSPMKINEDFSFDLREVVKRCKVVKDYDLHSMFRNDVTTTFVRLAKKQLV